MFYKPILPNLRGNSLILDFVGPRSTLLFKTLGVPHSLLCSQNWKDQSEYNKVKAVIRNLASLNDCSERALALAKSTITPGKTSQQNLILVVETQRKKCYLKAKIELKKLL